MSPDLEVYSDHSLYLDIDLKIIMLQCPVYLSSKENSNVNKYILLCVYDIIIYVSLVKYKYFC